MVLSNDAMMCLCHCPSTAGYEMAGSELRTTHVTYDKAGKLDITAGEAAKCQVPGSTRLGVSPGRCTNAHRGPVRPGRTCPLACQAALPLTENSLWQAPF